MVLASASKALTIDLSTNKIKVEDVPSSYITRYIGGRGVNAAYLFDTTEKDTDPLGESNPIIFGTGPFAGTSIPTAGQLTVTSKSPLTNLYFKCNSGGHFASELRFAGYTYIIIKGKADKPVYLWIDNDHADIKDASHIWGKDTRETNIILRKELGKDIHVACIGPAGERLVKFAGISVSVYHFAARGGLGAVMGAKNLKAIAVHGNKEKLEVYDPHLLRQLVLDAVSKIPKSVKAVTYMKYGTSGSIDPINEIGALPSYNFKEPSFEKAAEIDGVTLVERQYIRKRKACTACPMHCHKYLTVDKGKYQCYGGGPEYETLAAFGAGCGIGDPEAVLYLHIHCGLYGLDGLSAAAAIQWTMECIEKGILSKEDVDGLNLTWGNADSTIELLKKIAYREGFGNLLAEGLRKASSIVGKDSWKYAIQARGLEQSRVDTRSAKAYALAFAVNPRGPDHLHAQPMAEFGIYPESRELVKQLSGDVRYANPYIPDKKADLVRWHEDMFALTEVLGLCSFATTTTYILTPETLAEMYYAITGAKIQDNDLMRIGRRVITLERCFNIREGLTKNDDTLPWRLMNEPVNKGPAKGLVNSKEELDKLLHEYYVLHEWDTETGKPTYETLVKLEMRDIADKLRVLGIIS
jgi:aldehyde:ferredoxin oxidoreductase